MEGEGDGEGETERAESEGERERMGRREAGRERSIGRGGERERRRE